MTVDDTGGDNDERAVATPGLLSKLTFHQIWSLQDASCLLVKEKIAIRRESPFVKKIQYVISRTISSAHPMRRDRDIASKNWWHQIDSDWCRLDHGITRVWGHLVSPKAGGSKLIVGTNSTSSLNETTLPHHTHFTTPSLSSDTIWYHPEVFSSSTMDHSESKSLGMGSAELCLGLV